MKLLRNSYREILFLLYYSLASLLPVMTVLRVFHTLPHLNLLVESTLLFFAGLIATFLTFMGILVFYTFLSTVLQGRHQSVESFYR